MIKKYRFDFKREDKQTNTQTKKQTTFLKNIKTYNMALRNTDRK